MFGTTITTAGTLKYMVVVVGMVEAVKRGVVPHLMPSIVTAFFTLGGAWLIVHDDLILLKQEHKTLTAAVATLNDKTIPELTRTNERQWEAIRGIIVQQGEDRRLVQGKIKK